MEILGIASLVLALAAAVAVGIFRIIRIALQSKKTTRQYGDLETRRIKDIAIQMKTKNSKESYDKWQTTYLRALKDLEDNNKSRCNIDLSKAELENEPANMRSFIYEK